jgi:hypothetical protein
MSISRTPTALPSLCRVLCLLIAASSSGAATAATGGASTPPCPAPPATLTALRGLLTADPRAALEGAEHAVSECPRQRSLQRILSAARQSSGDVPGAIRGLRDHLTADPLDCESWSWLAWLALERGDHALAWQALQAPGCPDSGQTAARQALLEAWFDLDVADQAAARTALAKVGDTVALWPEDASLDATLRRRLDPTWQPPAAVGGEVGVGGTSDAFAGSPVDTARNDIASALGTLRAFGRLAPPWRGPVTPFVAADLDAHGIADEDARELSYLDLGGRAGVELPFARTLVRAAYRREALFLNVEEDSRYSVANRAELEAELPSGMVVLAGGGHRDYLDPWRTRRELDGGVVAPLARGSFPISAGVSLRGYAASRAVWNQRGATLTAVTAHSLGRRLTGRAAVTVARDVYPDSGGLDGLLAFGSREERRDLLVRLSLGVMRRVGAHLLSGLGYELAHRSSTIDRGLYGSYEYTEHRLMLTLRFGGAGSPWRARARADADHVPLEYGLARPAVDLGLEPARELLRQSEELRRDCGCTPH